MNIANRFACALALCSVAFAQTPPCIAFNDTNNNVDTSFITSYGFGGQNSYAWQFTPQAAVTLLSAAVFTRNSALAGNRFMILEIWSDAGGLPGARLAGGAWRIVNARPYAWQGTNFDAVVPLTPGTPYWVVWVEPGFSTVPLEVAGLDVLPRTQRTGTGAWGTALTNESPKIRLFCSQLDDANSYPYGPFCFTSGGTLPSVLTNESPNIGNATFLIETTGSPAGVPVFLVLGLDPTFAFTPALLLPPGCFQNTDIVDALLLTAGTGNTRGATCAGHASQLLPIPLDNRLIGTVLAAQSVPFDAGAASVLPFAASAALRMTVY